MLRRKKTGEEGSADFEELYFPRYTSLSKIIPEIYWEIK